MKKLIAGFMLVMVLALSACSTKQIDYAVDMAAINSNYNLMIERYSIVRSLAVDKWEIFTEEEQRDLKMVDVNVELVKTKVNSLRSRDFHNVTPSEIGYMYTLAKDTYEVARRITVAHEDQLTNSQMLTLKIFDQQLTDLDGDVAELMNDPANADINRIMTTILGVGGAAMKILLPLLL